VKTTTSIIVLCGALLFVGLMAMYRPVPTDTHQISELTLFTKPLASLPPHTHELGDNPTDPGHGVFVASEVLTMEQDLWITDIEPVIEGAPYAVNHHLVLEMLNEQDHLCSNLTRKLLVAGSDTRGATFPEPFGYLLKKGDQLHVTGILHNAEVPLGTGETYTNVRAGYRMKIATSTERRSRPLYFYIFSLKEPPYCQIEDNSVFTIPPHSPEFSIRSNLQSPNNTYATVPTDGVIIGIGTHTHGWQGGGVIDVFINNVLYKHFLSTRQDTIPPTWLSESTGSLLPVKAGDTVTATSYYHNPHSVPTNGAMAIIGLYFAPH
jgi:hypothetical protein